jgi:hypothetical protein
MECGTVGLSPMPVTHMLASAVNIFGIRTGESPKYDVLHADGELEIRRYPAHLRAKLLVAGPYVESTRSGFKRLASFISGHNSGSVQLYPPGSAAQANIRGEHIAMTAPVLFAPAEGGWTTAFILPRRYSFSTAPKPLDAEIELEQVPQQTMAILRYSGHVDEDGIQRKFRELRGWVQSIGWRSISEPLAAQYDPPFTIPFLKRNEVLVRAEPLQA